MVDNHLDRVIKFGFQDKMKDTFHHMRYADHVDVYYSRYESCLNSFFDPKVLDRLKRIETAYRLANKDGFRI